MSDKLNQQSLACLTDQELAEFDLGAVGGGRFEAISRHLDACQFCADRFEQLAQQTDSVLDNIRVDLRPEALRAQSEFDQLVREVGSEFMLGETDLHGQQDLPSTIDCSAQPGGDALPGRGTASRQFGDYQLVEEIAHGGMGIVYKAWDKELKCHVALKTIRSGEFAGAQEIERFHREAEAAANLQHPGIVRVHQFGQYAGAHYFTMDFVDGQSLGQLIDNQPLDIETAVKFTIEICEAIEFAHQHGVLHRDLKPANVLVDRESNRALVSDFGLAKRIDQDSDFTQTGQALGTPAYMPPEQAFGRKQEIGFQSDVYSIGALLYHLLTGRPPFTGETNHQILTQVINKDPLPPRKLNPRVPRDLNTICLKCLDKNRGNRYVSAAELRDDLRRFTQGFPIRARPATLLQHGWRWCQRNRLTASLGFAISLVVLITITLGVILGRNLDAQLVSATERLDAEIARAARIDESAHDAWIPGDLRDDTEILRAALENYNLLRAQWWSSPEDQIGDIPRQRKLADALFRVAQASRLLGEFEASETNFGDAIERFEFLSRSVPDDPRLAVMHGKSLDYLGELYREYGSRVEANKEAENAYQQSLTILTLCANKFPSHAEAELELARTENNYGIFLQQSCRQHDATIQYEQAERRMRAILDAQPENPEFRRDFARTLINVGVLQRKTGRPDEAVSSYKEAIGEFESLLQTDPNNARYRFLLSITRMNLGYTRDQSGEFAKAQVLYDQALSGFRSLPTDRIPEYRLSLAKCLVNLASNYGMQGDLKKSFESCKQAELELSALLEKHPNVAEIASWMGVLHGNLGAIESARGNFEQFSQHLNQAISFQQRAADDHRHACAYEERLMGHHRFFALQILDHFLDQDQQSRQDIAVKQIVAATQYGYRDDFSQARFDPIRDLPQFIAVSRTFSR